MEFRGPQRLAHAAVASHQLLLETLDEVGGSRCWSGRTGITLIAFRALNSLRALLACVALGALDSLDASPLGPWGPVWMKFSGFSFLAQLAPASLSMTRSWPDGFELAL
jgi:hypothetical protein